MFNIGLRAIQISKVAPKLNNSHAIVLSRSLAITPRLYNNAEAESSGVIQDQPQKNRMTWEEYFQYKKARQIREKLLAFPSSFIATGTTGSYLLTNVQLDPANGGLIYGFDPILVFIAASALSGFASFLIAPLVGTLIYRVVKPKIHHQMIEMDADFYKRIAKYRVNMAIQPRSVSSPPDFYGERINSLNAYRHWLRRQYQYRRQRDFDRFEEKL